MTNSDSLPPPPPPPRSRWKRRTIVLVSVVAIVAILLFVLVTDIDADGLNGYTEISKYGTNPFFSDTDFDGLPDKWEIDYGFNPTNAQDARKDPDRDGLTNVQEYQLGTIAKNGALSFDKDLFVEIDYMSGYKPSTDAINWFTSYYKELGIVVHVTIDDEISDSQLTSVGVSPASLTSSECSLVKQRFHDNAATHVYVFYAKAIGDPGESQPLGWSSEFGAFINKELVNANEGLRVLWLTDRIRSEKVVLLHEVGHTLNVVTWSNGKENYCSSFGCIMANADTWWDVLGGIAGVAAFNSNSPRYCQTHAKQINLTNKESVNENWIP